MENLKIEQNRRIGKSTRLIDNAIQFLFKTDAICIPFGSMFEMRRENNLVGIFKDEGDKYHNQKCFANRIIKRLNLEHANQFEVNETSRGIIIKLKGRVMQSRDLNFKLKNDGWYYSETNPEIRYKYVYQIEPITNVTFTEYRFEIFKRPYLFGLLGRKKWEYLVQTNSFRDGFSFCNYMLKK